MAPVKDICRICLQEAGYNETQDIDLDKLGNFTNSCRLPVLDLELFQNHLVCDTCIYNFRTLRTIHKFVSKGNEEVNKKRSDRRVHNLRYIDIKPQKNKSSKTQDDLAVCRLCFEPTMHIAIYLWSSKRNIVPLEYINKMLQYIDLSMDLLQSTINPILCYKCWQRVQVAFSFRKRVEAVTDKCMHYLKLLQKTYLDREDLSDILHMWDDLGRYNTETISDASESPISIRQSPAAESPAHETMPQLYPEYICTEEHNYCAKRPLANSQRSFTPTNSDTISAVDVDDFDMPVLTPCFYDDAKELKKVKLPENGTRRITRAMNSLKFDESVLGLKTTKRKRSKKTINSSTFKPTDNREQLVDDSFRRVTRLSSLKEDTKVEYSSSDLLVLTKEEIIKKKPVRNKKVLFPKLASKLTTNKDPPKNIPSTKSPVKQFSSDYTIERLNFDNEVQKDTKDDNVRKKKLEKKSKSLEPKRTSTTRKLNSDSSKNKVSPLKFPCNEYTIERLNFDNEVQPDREAFEEEEIEIKREIVSDSDDAFIETSAGFADDSDDDLPEQCPNLDVFIKTEPSEIIDEEENEPPQLEFQGPCVYDPNFTIWNTFSVNDKRNLISVDEKRNLMNVSNESSALETGDPMEIRRKATASAQQNGFYNKMTQKPPELKMAQVSVADFKPKEVFINLIKCDLPSTSRPVIRTEFQSMPNIVNNPQQTGKIKIKSIKTLLYPKFNQKNGASASSNTETKPQQEAPPVPIKSLPPILPKSDQGASIIETKSVPKEINNLLPAGTDNNPPEKTKIKTTKRKRRKRKRLPLPKNNYSFRENTKNSPKNRSQVDKTRYREAYYYYKELEYLTVSKASPYNCRMCDFITTKRTKARGHVALHFTKPSYLHICNVCSFRATNTTSLKSHIQINHDPSFRPARTSKKSKRRKESAPDRTRCGYCRSLDPQMLCRKCKQYFHARCLLFDQNRKLFNCSHFRVFGCITISKTRYRYIPSGKNTKAVCNACENMTTAWVHCRMCSKYFHFRCFNSYNNDKIHREDPCYHLSSQDPLVKRTKKKEINEKKLNEEHRSCDFCSRALDSVIPCPSCLKFMHQHCFLQDSKQMKFNCRHADIIGEVSLDCQKASVEEPKAATSREAKIELMDFSDFIMLCD